MSTSARDATHLLSACSVLGFIGTMSLESPVASPTILLDIIELIPVLSYVSGNPESVVQNENAKIYWYYSFPTLRTSKLIELM